MTIHAAIPTLETERLILRAPQIADYPAFAALMRSDRSKYMGGPYHDEGHIWGMFCHAAGSWVYFGQGALTVEHEGVAIGSVQLNNGPLFPETELGWDLFDDGHEGQGFATEAATALRDWAFATAKLETLVSYTHPDNAKSQAVARRLGGVEDVTAARQDEEDIVFRYPRPGA